MKVEVMALGKIADLDRALGMLGAEGRYEFHVAGEGMPLAGRGEAPTLIVDRLASLACTDLDAMRRAVNGLEAQGYDRVVFIAVLNKHDSFSKADRQRIEAIERDVLIRKLVGRNKVRRRAQLVRVAPAGGDQTNWALQAVAGLATAGAPRLGCLRNARLVAAGGAGILAKSRH